MGLATVQALRFAVSAPPVAWAAALVRAVAACAIPPHCALCEGFLDGPRAPALCTRCFAAIPPISDDVCVKCGAPQGPHVGRIKACQACRGRLVGVRRVVALGEYDGAIEHAIKRFKYGRRPHLAMALAALLAGQLADEPFVEALDAVVAVPLHWRKRLIRGFDQAELLALAVSRKLDKPCWPSALRRQRPTAPQASLLLERRASNVRGAFVATKSLAKRMDELRTAAAKPTGKGAHWGGGRLARRELETPSRMILDQVSPARPGAAASLGPNVRKRDTDGATAAADRSRRPVRVLLIDDVMSSGHTLVAAATALRAGGVTSVYGAVIGRAR